MRLHIANKIKENEYLVHSDMFNVSKFPVKCNVINTGLSELNALNISTGLALNNNTVYLYGVCGFIIHKYEQLRFGIRDIGSKKGKIIIFNAGKIGYESIGPGHILDDDLDIMKILKIPYFIPKDLKDLDKILQKIEKEKTGVFYIQLGKDYNRY
jgi:transketolase C-terminal domain/subunit